MSKHRRKKMHLQYVLCTFKPKDEKHINILDEHFEKQHVKKQYLFGPNTPPKHLTKPVNNR